MITPTDGTRLEIEIDTNVVDANTRARMILEGLICRAEERDRSQELYLGNGTEDEQEDDIAEISNFVHKIIEVAEGYYA